MRAWKAVGRGCVMVMFDCPGCEFSHGVAVSAVEGHEGPVWKWNGSMDLPTLQPSVVVQIKDGKKVIHVCHSWVKDGRIQFLPDCTHKLAGQTVDLPEAT